MKGGMRFPSPACQVLLKLYNDNSTFRVCIRCMLDGGNDKITMFGNISYKITTMIDQ